MTFNDWRTVARKGAAFSSEAMILTTPKANTNMAAGVVSHSTIYLLANNVCMHILSHNKNADIVNIPDDRVYVVMYNINALCGKHLDRNIEDIMREIMDMSAYECTIEPAFRLFFLMHTYTLDIRAAMTEAHARTFTCKTVVTKQIKPGVAGSEIVDGAPCCTVDFLVGRQTNGVLRLISAKMVDVPIYTQEHVRTTILSVSKTLSIEYEEKLFDAEEYDNYIASLGEMGTDAMYTALPDDAPDLPPVQPPVSAKPAPVPLSHCTSITAPNIEHEDIYTLNTLKFTDNVLHFFVLESIKRLATPPTNVYIYNTHLMQHMCVSKTPYDNTAPDGIEKQITYLFNSTLKNYGTVPSKTNRNERVSCITDKEFLFIPANSAERGGQNNVPVSDGHWVLYIVYRPFEAESAPLIFVVDTLYNTATQTGYMSTSQHARNMVRIRHFLTLVAQKYLPSRPDAVSTTRKSCFMPCPQQPPNTNACGAYISMYITLFLTQTPEERADFVALLQSGERRRTGPVMYEKHFREIQIDALRIKLIDAVKKDFTEKNKKIKK